MVRKKVYKNYITIFSIARVILSDLAHWVMITKISLGKGPVLYFGFMGRRILIEDLMES